jgi:hypothetical protein
LTPVSDLAGGLWLSGGVIVIVKLYSKAKPAKRLAGLRQIRCAGHEIEREDAHEIDAEFQTDATEEGALRGDGGGAQRRCLAQPRRSVPAARQ